METEHVENNALEFLSAESSESKKLSLCLSPRTPYILAPRSVYAFSSSALKPSSLKNGDIPFFPIFLIIFEYFVFIHGNLTLIFRCEPSINRPTVYGLLVKKSDRASVRSRSLRSDRAVYVLGRYVVTELRREIGRYVASELRLELGRYVATSFCAGCYAATLFASFSDFS
ncbi:hypothetical protein DY000_02016292 [Brassica cretica]|uniref:Uncharacterized protein n=1 Tax=Brassica cretica TaxID=69181 RepID=A0ABQ7CU24_BRACR|nr:hypothetical protein DY000_02016292 [Brassica cretica]